MKASCALTAKEFEITPEDLSFYQKIGVPPPTLCPEERLRRRISFANQRHLFSRTCTATGKKIITNFPPELELNVVDIKQFYDGEWDIYATGRDFDFNRPFFDQFAELMRDAVYPSVVRAHFLDENSDYTHHAGGNKDCYFIFDSDDCRECLFSYSLNQCINCLDCFRATSCELCYELIDCVNCYSSFYLQNCSGCSDSWFLKNCISCRNCFGCVNLRNKSYCFFNQQLTKEQYQQKLAAMNLGSRTNLESAKITFSQFVRKFPKRFMEGVMNENVLGNLLIESKNAQYCFDSRRLWDCKYMVQVFDDCKNSMDCSEIGNAAELCYESAYAGRPAYDLKFTACAFPNVSNLTYCYYTFGSQNCFGCAGLTKARYAIFNKQYSESDYNQLTEKIVSHMQSTGEWGEFFPARLSLFPYNLTHAHDFLPLTESEAKSRGYGWYEFADRTNEVNSPPDSGNGEQLGAQVFVCKKSRRPYRMQKAELQFYQIHGLPLPDLEFNERHLLRLAQRPNWKLYPRKCAQCNKDLLSAISPEQGEVLCEDDFNRAVE